MVLQEILLEPKDPPLLPTLLFAMLMTDGGTFDSDHVAKVVRMHRDLSSYACHTSKHLCTERTTSERLMFCHQKLSIANRCVTEALHTTTRDLPYCISSCDRPETLGEVSVNIDIYTRCVRKVSDLRSYLRVGGILRHLDCGIL